MHPLVNLAKLAIETYVQKGEIISPSFDLPKEFLERKAGVFVTIKNGGNLRGCIGTYAPTKENTAIETISNAISAATQDIRFDPVSESELSSLEYEVSLLDEIERIKDISELDVKKYGILVQSETSSKSGLLLPDLDGINSVEGQIFIASQKAGIDLSREKIIIYRFLVEKF